MPPRSLPLKTLSEAVRGPQMVPISVCAWVSWFSIIRSSSGSDHYILLHLSDDSLVAEDMALVRDPSMERQPDEPPYVTCVIFGPQHLLPQFDLQDSLRLIYLHQTKMKLYKQERQLQVRLRPVKMRQDGDTFSVYLATEETVDEQPPMPFATSHPPCSMANEQVDQERIRFLRKWILQRAQRHLTTPGPANLPVASAPPLAQSPHQDVLTGVKAIRELVPPMAADGVTLVAGLMPPVNLICKVLAVDFSRYPSCFILHVWDGTDTYPTPLTYNSDPGDEAAGGSGGPRAVAAELPAPRHMCNHDCDQHGSAVPTPPRFGRLPMPLSSIAHFAADLTVATDGTDSGDAACSRSGWEVLSAVLNGQEMPTWGSNVPLVMPTAFFHVTPPEAPTQPPSPVAVDAAAGNQNHAATRAAAVKAPPQLLPRPGDWIKLKNVRPHFVQGQLQVLFSELSSVELRSPNTPTSSHGEQLARLLQGGAGLHALPVAPREPETWLARVTPSWQTLPLRTLRQVLMQRETCDCTPSRVLVRVIAVLNPPLPPMPSPTPGGAAGSAAIGCDGDGDNIAAASSVPELRRLLRCAVMPADDMKAGKEVVGTQLDRGGNGLSFALALLLQDATASLRAVVLGGAANLFLWNLSPPDLMAATTGTFDKQAGRPELEVTLLRDSNSQSESQPQPQAAEAAIAKSRPIMTRSQTKAAAATSMILMPAAARPTASAPMPSTSVTVAPTSASEEETAAAPRREQQISREQQFREPVGDELHKLVSVLHWLSEQSVPGGTWMEAVLRPMYRDRSNPWQSAVYSLEHTMLQLPSHLRTRAATGQDDFPGMEMGSSMAPAL